MANDVIPSAPLFPILLLEYRTRQAVSADILDMLERDLRGELNRLFRERLLQYYSAYQIGFIGDALFTIELSPGSIRFRQVFLGMASGLLLGGLAGCTHECPTYRQEVHETFEQTEHAVSRVLEQFVLDRPIRWADDGEIARIDLAIDDALAQRISFEECSLRIKTLLDQLAAAPNRNQIVRDLRVYIEHRYGTVFDYERLQKILVEQETGRSPRIAGAGDARPVSTADEHFIVRERLAHALQAVFEGELRLPRQELHNPADLSKMVETAVQKAFDERDRTESYSWRVITPFMRGDYFIATFQLAFVLGDISGVVQFFQQLIGLRQRLARHLEAQSQPGGSTTLKPSEKTLNDLQKIAKDEWLSGHSKHAFERRAKTLQAEASLEEANDIALAMSTYAAVSEQLDLSRD